MQDQLTNLLPKLVVLIGGSGGILYWTLKKALEARFNEKLEKVKHELQLDLAKKSIVFDHQKDSFRKLLSAMHEAVESVEAKQVPDGGDWEPISMKPCERFGTMAAEESLFIDDETDRALRLFSNAMYDASYGPEHQPRPHEVWRAYRQMIFIQKRVTQHFRNVVGFEPAVLAPLHDVELLGACRLINRFHFPDFGMPHKGILSINDNNPPEAVVANAKGNRELLVSELEKLRLAMSRSPAAAGFWFDDIATVDNFLKRIQPQ